MSTIINNNAITKMYKGDTPIYSFSINTGGNITLTNIDITTNGTYTAPDGEGYKTINVDVPSGGGTGKIDVAATGIKLSHSTFREVPDIYDFSNVTDMTYMFSDCSSLQSIPNLNTSNATNMTYMFTGCAKLQNVPYFNTHNVTNMEYMFSGCTSLQSIPLLDTVNVQIMGGMFRDCSNVFEFPLLDTRNVTDMVCLFLNCNKITTIPQLDTTKVTNMIGMFYGCSSLQSIPLLECGKATLMNNFFGYFTIPTLTDLGGFKDLKISITSGFLDMLPNLTVESLMNVINNVYDLTGNGLSGQTLKFGQTNLDKLTPEQIAVATAKGWTLTA